MGVVYRAEDIHLGREVALKIIAEETAQDSVALERFNREARNAASLNHPHICTVYEVGEFHGRPFLAMELLEGESLNKIIARGPVPVLTVLRWGSQIVDGLDAAHARGLVHRDIKPANLFVTSQGQTKILDFGVAKFAPARRHETRALNPRNAETLVAEILTTPGMTPGTPAYMSPEQVRGEEIDGRSDLFSFGIVMYEMVTGRMPFHGRTSGAVMASIMHDRPVMPSELNVRISPRLEEIIDKTLEKERSHRYQRAVDLRVDLQRLARDLEGRSPSLGDWTDVFRIRSRKWIWLTLMASAVSLAIILLAFALLRPEKQPRIIATRQITNDGRQKFFHLTDGNRLYYTASTESNVYENFQVSVKGGESMPLPDYTRGMMLQGISPDRTELLFEKRQQTTSGPWPLWQISATGGTPQKIGELDVSFGASWSPDALRLVYAKAHELYIANSDGTASHRLIAVEGTPSSPVWSPNASSVRFDIHDSSGSTSIWEVMANGGGLHRVFPNLKDAHCCGSWTGDGKYFLFDSGHQIWVTRERSMAFSRANHQAWQLTAGPTILSWPISSPDGRRLFAMGWQPRTEIARFDARSRQFLPYLAGTSAEGLDFSPNGKLLVYVEFPQGTLWRANLDGTKRQELTFLPLSAGLPRWSPDSREIAFVGSLSGKRPQIYVMSSDGGSPRMITDGTSSAAGDLDPTWSPDGLSLAYGGSPYSYPYFQTDKGQLSIRIVDVKSRRSTILPGTDGLWGPRWSPNGKYIVALSYDSQSLILYEVRTQKQTKIAQGDPNYFGWSRDSKFVYFDTLGSSPSFFRIRVRDRLTQKLASLEGVHRSVGSFGTWTGVAPDNSLLVQRDAGAPEIYAFDWAAP